mgnify:CR=1 FL=1
MLHLLYLIMILLTFRLFLIGNLKLSSSRPKVQEKLDNPKIMMIVWIFYSIAWPVIVVLLIISVLKNIFKRIKINIQKGVNK